MEGENGVTRSIIDEIRSWDIQRDQMEDETGVLELSWMNFILGISKEIKRKGKVVLLEVSLMNFILRISSEIKWTVKVVLLEVSLMNFILRISKDIKWKVKVVLVEFVIAELHYSDIQGEQMEGESGFPRSIIDELHSLDIR